MTTCRPAARPEPARDPPTAARTGPESTVVPTAPRARLRPTVAPTAPRAARVRWTAARTRLASTVEPTEARADRNARSDRSTGRPIRPPGATSVHQRRP